MDFPDYATLNSRMKLQTHLFEDRVTNVVEVLIEDKAIIGRKIILLPNIRLSPLAKREPLSLMMKGEGIPANTSWQGISRQDGP